MNGFEILSGVDRVAIDEEGHVYIVGKTVHTKQYSDNKAST